MVPSDFASRSIVLFWALATARSARRWPSSSLRPGSRAGRSARLEIRSVDDFAAAPEVVEDADTFAGNARKKASGAGAGACRSGSSPTIRAWRSTRWGCARGLFGALRRRAHR